MIDETLMHARTVTGMSEPDDGIGFDAVLSCGHAVWCPLRPGAKLVCGLCLTIMIDQITEARGLLDQMPSNVRVR